METKHKFIGLVILLGVIILGGSAYFYLNNSETPLSLSVSFSSSDAAGVMANNDLLLELRELHANQKTPSEKAQIGQQMRFVAESRKDQMLALADSNPKEFLTLSLPTSVRDGFPDDIKNLIEKEEVVTGNLLNMHTDVEDPKDYRELYFLEEKKATSQEKRHLKLKVTDESQLPINKEVTMSGTVLGTAMVSDTQSTGTIQNVQESTTLQALASTGARKVLVMMVNFQNDRSMPVTATAINSKVFGTGTDSLNTFIDQNSFSKASLYGRTVGWYTIPYNTPITDAECGDDPNFLYNYADAADKLAGANLDSSVELKIYYFPQMSCKWLGQFWGDRIWINNKNSQFVYGHEIGHVYGASHMGYASCGSVSIGTLCTPKDYGPWDVMGSPNLTQYNAAHKVKFGWIPFANVKNITTSGTYTITIHPSEKSLSGIQLVTIPTVFISGIDPSTYIQPVYSLTYRQLIGFDSGLPAGRVGGVLVSRDSKAHIRSLDMSPDDNWDDVTLRDGQIFNDSIGKVTIKQNSHNADGVNLTITYGGGTTTATTSTSPTPTTMPPLSELVISNVKATPTSSTMALITWTTSQPSTSRILYGLRRNSLTKSTSLDTILTTNHRVYVTSLSGNYRYYFKVYSKNSSGREISSDVGSFRTP